MFPPYTSADFGLERPLMLMIQQELGFCGGVLFVWFFVCFLNSECISIKFSKGKKKHCSCVVQF